jgi:A118 family predicted phage portal protein
VVAGTTPAGEPKGPTPEDQRLQKVMDGLRARLSESGEVGAALGGVYLRAGWDVDLADQPIVDAIHPDNAWPEFRRGFLTRLTTAKVLVRDGVRVWRHVETYEPGLHLHGLYIGTEDSLGTQVQLSGHPDTAGLEPVVVIPGGLLPVQYVPNMLPNRIDRGSSMGRSDYSGSEGVLDNLDEAWSSWMRDLRLAKARVIVASEYLESAGPGQGAGFDPDREVFESLNIPPLSATGGAAITPVQFAIRVQEHSDTTRALVEEIVRAAGYSPGTFGMDAEDGGPAVTATEVTAKQRRSFTTRRKKINYWDPALLHLAKVWTAIDAEVFKQTPVAPDALRVSWPDGVSDGILTLAQTAVALRTAEAASDETLVQLVHPDWDATEVKAEVDRMAKAREALAPPDPFAGIPA